MGGRRGASQAGLSTVNVADVVPSDAIRGDGPVDDLVDTLVEKNRLSESALAVEPSLLAVDGELGSQLYLALGCGALG